MPCCSHQAGKQMALGLYESLHEIGDFLAEQSFWYIDCSGMVFRPYGGVYESTSPSRLANKCPEEEFCLEHTLRFPRWEKVRPQPALSHT